MPESKKRKKVKQHKTATPPKPVSVARSQPPSPTWYVALMAGLMAAGGIMVLIRFVFSTSPVVLLAGLILISVGFLMTLNYH